MKKTFLMLAIVLSAFAACTKASLVENAQNPSSDFTFK